MTPQQLETIKELCYICDTGQDRNHADMAVYFPSDSLEPIRYLDFDISVGSVSDAYLENGKFVYRCSSTLDWCECDWDRRNLPYD